MVGGRFGAAVWLAVYVAAVVGAGAAEWMSPSLARAVPGAVFEAIPALLLAVATVRAGGGAASRAGQLCFAVAMVLLAGSVVATSGVVADGLALALGTVAAVSLLLAVGYVCLLIAGSTRRRWWTVGVAALLILVALFPANAAILAWADTPRHCGVDSCAFTGLGIAFGFGVAGLLMLLAVLVTALAVDGRAALGVLLFGAGVVGLMVASPGVNQYQSAMSVCIGYVGLALAASPWLSRRVSDVESMQELAVDG